MADLKTNYVDDILDGSVNDKRRYRMVQNADGTFSFDDVTTYMQNGDTFGAKDVNDTNTAVNELNENLSITTNTLTAGSTQVEIENKRINSNSALTFYASIYGISPEEVIVEDGKVTLTFDAQDTDMIVGVRIDA